MVNPTKDGVSKDLLGINENFASVFNYFLFKGAKRIRPGRLHDVHTEHRYFAEDEFEAVLAEEKRARDILKVVSVKEGARARYLFLGIESQSSIDCYMVLRIMLYDTLSYLTQLKSTEGKRKRLKPVITIIFNCSGKPWKKGLSLYDILDIPSDLKDLFEVYCGNHTVILFDPYSMKDSELEMFSRDMEIVTKALKYSNNRKRYYAFMTRDEMKDVSDTVYYAITVLNNDKETRLIRNRKGNVDMCRATREIAEEKRIKWTSEGYSEGIAEGVAEGKAEGRLEGMAKSVRAAIVNFSVTPDEAMEKLEIPIADRDRILVMINS